MFQICEFFQNNFSNFSKYEKVLIEFVLLSCGPLLRQLTRTVYGNTHDRPTASSPNIRFSQTPTNYHNTGALLRLVHK